MWHLGSGCDLAASCIVLLVHRYFSGSNIEQSLARATAQDLQTQSDAEKVDESRRVLVFGFLSGSEGKRLRHGRDFAMA